ncbi:MAG: hypothetical protein ACRET5_01955, partial [Steroidobacteraceae bacterium]
MQRGADGASSVATVTMPSPAGVDLERSEPSAPVHLEAGGARLFAGDIVSTTRDCDSDSTTLELAGLEHRLERIQAVGVRGNGFAQTPCDFAEAVTSDARIAYRHLDPVPAEAHQSVRDLLTQRGLGDLETRPLSAWALLRVLSIELGTS